MKLDLTTTRPEFNKQGFPDIVIDAFTETAEKLDAVVLSRVPGPASTQLIDEGHALKSFYVHGKSCNWGPMAGFVCQMPAFNKRGVSKLEYNLDEHVSSQNKFTKVREEEAEILSAFTKKQSADNKSAQTEEEQKKELDRTLAASPWMPLTISDKALDRLFVLPLNAVVGIHVANHDPGSRSISPITGIASSPENDVVMEFVLIKAETGQGNAGWLVYHRRAWIYAKKSWKPYFSIDVVGLKLLQNDTIKTKVTDLTPTNGGIPISSADNGHNFVGGDELNLQITDWQKANKIDLPDHSVMDQIYPVRVAQNPYIPYTRDDPLNAITGDYDLFALWQCHPPRPRESVIRFSEMNTVLVEATNSPVFRRSIDRQRPFTACLSAQTGVYVEVLPNYTEMAVYEHPIIGNINEATYFAVGILNSLALEKYGKKDFRRNVAFHSDEGGRPGIDEIEYPVAVFAPASLRGKADDDNVGLLLNNHQEFMSLLESLAGTCEIGLAHGWLMHLVCDIAPKEKLTSRIKDGEEDAKKYFQRRLDYQIEQGDAIVELRFRVASFLTGANSANDDNVAFTKAVDNVLNFANDFVTHKNKPASELLDLLVAPELLHALDNR
jgi:hypothetical protein